MLQSNQLTPLSISFCSNPNYFTWSPQNEDELKESYHSHALEWMHHLKWVEAIPLKNATGPVVANFIKKNIICRFGIPKRILSNNGTLFINSNVRELLALYDVDHVKSSPYYPKGNDQVEATNKTLLKDT